MANMENSKEVKETNFDTESINSLNSFKDVEIEIKGLVATNKMLLEYQRESKKQNKGLRKIITLLIVLLFLEGTISFGLFVWYESQFEVVDTSTVTETEDFYTEGDNANINKVDGNQYNDNATHNENK